MTEERSERTATGRGWLWGGIGALAAVVAGTAIVLSMVNTPAAVPAPSPTSELAGPTPTGSPTTPPVCDASAAGDLRWVDNDVIAAPADGDITATPIVELTGVGAGAESRAFAIDEDLFGVIVQTGDSDTLSSISVVDRESGAVAWTTEVAGAADIVSTPQSTGVEGILVFTVWNGGETRLLSLDLSDGTLRTERPTAAAHSGLPNREGSADIARPGATSFFTTDRETLHLIDASTLEDVWTASGDEYDVGDFEGGVPFFVAGDVAFVGSHALDAATGEPLGWESAGGWVFPGSGATLQLPLSDGPDLLALSGLDTTSGQSCWSRDVWSVAAWEDAVWIITAERAVEEIDPLTGKTRDVIVEETSADAWLTVAGGRLVLVENSDEAARNRVFEGGEEAGLMTHDDALSASGQVLSISERGAVTARGLDGAEAWRFDDPLETWFAAGVMLGSDSDADRGSFEVSLYH
ncbi:hypothetical protein [Microbacterium sp. T2.11-28]|uniref:hypothetical protein n=1 Tax=unclassified Microbacterium TaxID=2609290 RepID=UPI0024778A27|nr:hypothetical protein [Microbacterium sp. T2.11-28]CAI9390459.1 hypothetical protein MICABA_01466 [Microbacterium sp. T2.11-28]